MEDSSSMIITISSSISYASILSIMIYTPTGSQSTSSAASASLSSCLKGHEKNQNRLKKISPSSKICPPP